MYTKPLYNGWFLFCTLSKKAPSISAKCLILKLPKLGSNHRPSD